jgi:RNA polymerase sigma-70 factor, ECF subfamily
MQMHLHIPPESFEMLATTNRNSAGADSLIEYIDGLYSYALALTRNRSDAEDLVQETYVRAIPAAKRLRTDSNVKGWLFTILRNIWLNQLRQPRHGLQVSETDIDNYPADADQSDFRDPHSTLVRRTDQEQVRKAIEQLPEHFREVILLREYEDLSYQEIAGILNCPIGTVMSRLGRARSRLRTLLSASLSISVSNTNRTTE